MGIEEFKTALDVMAKHPGLADFAGPRSEELVQSAERALGLLFPPSYREFVLRLGAGSVGSVEVFGVITDNFVDSAIPDAVWLTLRARKEWPLPRSMVVVYFDGMTGYFVLDTSRAQADHENPVVLWHPGRTKPDGAHQIMASDFGSFFLQRVRDEFVISRGATGPH